LDLNESLAFSDDGRWLASLIGGGVIVWDAATEKNIARLKLEGARAVIFDSQNRQLFCLTDKALFAVALPENLGGTLSEPRPVLSGNNLRGLDRSEDGRIAVGDAAGSLVHLFKNGTWTEIRLPIRPLRVAISADGHWLACGEYLNPNLYVSDVTRPDQPAVKLENAGDYGVFSPDGKRLFSFGHDVKGWSVGNWQPMPGLRAEPEDAESVIATVSRDGRWLASTQQDREVHLIDLATGKVVAVLDGPGEGGILALAFSPDGNTLVIARDRGDIQIWPLPALHAELQKLGLDW
jgi:WD40 repeat protein